MAPRTTYFFSASATNSNGNFWPPASLKFTTAAAGSLKVSCASSVAGFSVVFSAGASGGNTTGGYNYTWTGCSQDLVYPNACNKTFEQAGIYKNIVKVTAADASNHTASTNCSVTLSEPRTCNKPNGVDPFNRGTATITQGNAIIRQLSDVCQTGDILLESYCDNNSNGSVDIMQQQIYCSSFGMVCNKQASACKLPPRATDQICYAHTISDNTAGVFGGEVKLFKNGVLQNDIKDTCKDNNTLIHGTCNFAKGIPPYGDYKPQLVKCNVLLNGGFCQTDQTNIYYGNCVKQSVAMAPSPTLSNSTLTFLPTSIWSTIADFFSYFWSGFKAMFGK